MRRTMRLAAAALIAAAAVLTITQHALAAPATATFSRTSSWSNGYEGKYTISNGTTSTITA